jgi:transcription elongation factor Elf1
MKARSLTLNCPRCGSPDLVYSCEPECCFNHVCGECLSSFQLQTRDLGGRIPNVITRQRSERDTLAPTVPCASCSRLNVAMIDNEGATTTVCVDCGAILEIEFGDESR